MKNIKIKKYWKIAFLLWIVLSGTSFFLKDSFPSYVNIDKNLLKEPVQIETERKDFSFKYQDTIYDVSPMYDYELWGLVVSHNNINSIFDSYHTADSVDIKDLCVIWGDKNLDSNDFQEVKFWNVSWSCNWQYPYGVNFSNRELSNNHLLSDNADIRKAIQNTHVGDQIHLKGNLVSYDTNGQYPRSSSISRDDTGNHACEVIFVDEFEILSHPMFIFAEIWERFLLITFLFLIVPVVIFFREDKKEQKNSS